MSLWRRRLVAVLAEELGAARGEARLLGDRAAVAAAEARAEAETALADAARRRARLAAIRDRMTATHRARTGHGPRERAAVQRAVAAFAAEDAALAEAEEAAGRSRDRADRQAAEAAALAAETDRTAAVLWQALGGVAGRRRTGPTPYREPVGASFDAATVRARLERADRLLRLARRGEPPIRTPRHTVLAAAVGAAAAFPAAALAARLASGGLPAGWALAALALLAGVGAGPAVFGAWLLWRYRARPRRGHLRACLAAAIAVCALAGVFLRGM